MSRPGTDQRPGIRAARTLATGQIRLAQTFAHWADNHADDQPLADQFRSRIPAFRQLHVSTSRLAEVEPRRSPLLLAQQSEMLIQLRNPSLTDPLNPDVLHDLNHATHHLTTTLGRALRREATQAHNIVALDTTGLGPPTAQPMTRTGWAFTTACHRLADDPPPGAGQQQPAARVERDRLRTTLDQAVTGTPPPLRRMTPAIAQTAPRQPPTPPGPGPMTSP